MVADKMVWKKWHGPDGIWTIWYCTKWVSVSLEGSVLCNGIMGTGILILPVHVPVPAQSFWGHIVTITYDNESYYIGFSA